MYIEWGEICGTGCICEWYCNPPAGPMRRGPDAGQGLLYKKHHHVCLLESYMCTPPCCPSALWRQKLS